MFIDEVSWQRQKESRGKFYFGYHRREGGKTVAGSTAFSSQVELRHENLDNKSTTRLICCTPLTCRLPEDGGQHRETANCVQIDVFPF